MNNPQKLNYIVLSDGIEYFVFERLGKDVPFGAYNKEKHLGKGTSFDDAIANSTVPCWMIEDDPIEVIFNE